MSVKSCAQRIFDKCDNGISHIQYAVIMTTDRRDVKMTKPGTELFNKTLRLNPDMVVGVYDMRADESDIEQDLIFAGFIP